MIKNIRTLQRAIAALASVVFLGFGLVACDNPAGGSGGGGTPDPFAGFAPGLYQLSPEALLLAGSGTDPIQSPDDGYNIVDAIDRVNDSGGEYTLLVGANITLAGDNDRGLNASGARLTIIGIGGERRISLSSNGRMFTVGAAGQTGISLSIGNNITLVGRNQDAVGENNNQTLVLIQYGASLTMNAGARITGNTASGNSQAGGVHVNGAGSVFTMKGGVIAGNAVTGIISGGGVRVGSGASFRMYGGYIENNEARSTTGIIGGGVFINEAASAFYMLGGTVRNNRAPYSTAGAGGVRLSDGALRIVSGVIYGSGGANANTGAGYAALMLSTVATAHRGTIDGSGNWVQDDELESGAGLRGTSETIRVTNGELAN